MDPSHEDFFKRVEDCVNKKQNLKMTLFDLEQRFRDVELKVNVAKNNLFSGILSDEEKMTLLDNVKELLVLYREVKDVEHYGEIFDDEIKEKKITLNQQEKDKYNDLAVILRKSIPWKLAQTYQQLYHTFRESISNFFVDKYLTHFTPDELKEVTEMKNKIMQTIN